jgi:CRISPR-associated protein Cmr1
MKRAEDELWGAAGAEKPSPSQVQIRLEITNRGQSEQPFATRTRPSPDWRDLAYAAFPLQGDDKKPPGKVGVGVAFTLTLTFPQKQQAEVEAALWAWETFGGIGARTRRGFGALRLVQVGDRPVRLPKTGEVEAWVREGLRRHVVDGEWPAGVPHLSRNWYNLEVKVTKNRQTPKAAWTYLIRCLKKFRQARNSGVGRSRWPEPDAIRRLTGRRSAKHNQALLAIDKFPRAAFGLPVVFHFKDSGDPQDTILQGEDYDRLASPLILRPLACADGAVGLAIVLEGTGVAELPKNLVLKEKGMPGASGKSWPVTAALDKAGAQKIKPLNGDPDVLRAFLRTL